MDQLTVDSHPNANDFEETLGLLTPIHPLKFRFIIISNNITTFGRKASCDYVCDRFMDTLTKLQYECISQVHFVILHHNKRTFIRDHSFYGTFIDGVLIGNGNEVQIHHGAVISVIVKGFKIFRFSYLS